MTDETDRQASELLSRRNVLRVVGFVACLLAAALVLPLTEADDDTATGITAGVAARSAGGGLREKAEKLIEGDEKPTLSVSYQGPEHVRKRIFEELSQGKLDLVEAGQPADGVLEIEAGRDGDDVRLALKLTSQKLDEPWTSETKKRAGGWEAILPPLIAVLIALFFRRLIVALAAAVWMGATIYVDMQPFTGLWRASVEYVGGSFDSMFKIYIIIFTLALVGMVQVITRMGGVAGLLERVTGLARSARSTRVATALMGLAIFFDDYANTVVVGTTMRPVTDKKLISREKLAYIVDSTSAPIAGVAIISTWIGYEVGLFDELSAQLALGYSGYDIFFSILLLRFYCLFTLVFVVFNAWSGRDFGPMLTAERRAFHEGLVRRVGSTPLTRSGLTDVEPPDDIPHRWYNAVIPVTLVIVATLLGMFWSGWSGEGGASVPALFAEGWTSPGIGEVLAGWGSAVGDLGSWKAWRGAFSDADSAKVLFWSSMLGSITAIVLAVSQRLMSLKDAVMTWAGAVPAMWMAVVILLLAWSIQGVCDDLGTSIYLVGAVQDILSPAVLPLVTFLLAAVVAFATGTSWGTMGILLPAMIPLAFLLTQGAPNGELILFLCFGAVLDGAIFGDHCSPISDTTVMSSIAASCDHIDHVRTQLPYAVTSMLFAAGLGYVGVALGLPTVLAYVLAIVGIAAALWVLGRDVRAEEPTSQ